MQLSDPPRLLIVLFGAIGDVTRALPLAVRLKRAWPDMFLAWAIEPKAKGILENHPAIDELIVFERKRGLSGYRDFVSKVKACHFTIVLDLQRHFKSGLTSYLSKAPVRIGFHWRNAKEFNWFFNNKYIRPVPDIVSKIRHYQLFGDILGVPASKRLDFGIMPTVEESEQATAVLRAACEEVGIPLPPREKRVALLVSASWLSKQWPLERYNELARKLYDRGKFICFTVGSRDDVPLAKEIQLDAGIPIPTVAGRTNLRELAALFCKLNFAIGSDSGPMHIAAAMGLPVISIWGPTAPSRSGPHGFDELMLRPTVGCAPCYRRTCPGISTLCMNETSVEAIMQQVLKILRHNVSPA